MSFTGRASNLMVRRARPVWRLFWLAHRSLYFRTDGRRFRTIVGAPVLGLVTRGRVSGRERPVLLVTARRGDDLVVCASHAGHPDTPSWYRNLMASGRAEVLLDGERWPVRARPVTGPERDECWRLLVDVFPHDEEYQALSPREFPIAVLERAAG